MRVFSFPVSVTAYGVLRGPALIVGQPLIQWFIGLDDGWWLLCVESFTAFVAPQSEKGFVQRSIRCQTYVLGLRFASRRPWPFA